MASSSARVTAAAVLSRCLPMRTRWLRVVRSMKRLMCSTGQRVLPPPGRYSAISTHKGLTIFLRRRTAVLGQLFQSDQVSCTFLTAAAMLQVQLECLQALLRSCIELADTGGLLRLLDEHQELLLSGPTASLIELWLTAQAAALSPAFRDLESELAVRFATWQVIPQSSSYIPLPKN